MVATATILVPIILGRPTRRRVRVGRRDGRNGIFHIRVQHMGGPAAGVGAGAVAGGGGSGRPVVAGRVWAALTHLHISARAGRVRLILIIASVAVGGGHAQVVA